MAGNDSIPQLDLNIPMDELVILIENARAAGRICDAEQLCRAAIAREPTNASLQVWLGWMAMDRKAYGYALEVAHQAALLADHDAFSTTRLLVYSAAASGNWALAEKALLNISRSDNDAAQAIAAETAPVFLACINSLHECLAYEEAVKSFEQMPSILITVAPRVMRKIYETVSTCYLALGKPEAAVALFKQATSTTRLATPAEVMRLRPLLITSLMPTRIKIQKAAVVSWRRLGFDVVSLNAVDEIGHLHSEFQGVTFHVAHRDARRVLGRPLVYLDDMLAILAADPGRVVGIINSDIVFSNEAGDAIKEALLLANEAFLFGHRTDVECLDHPSGSRSGIYLFGYDWFLMRSDCVPRVAGGGMVFGAPWWDIWLPLRAKSLNFDIINMRRPIALHEIHSMRWNPADLKTMGEVLINNLTMDVRETIPVTHFQYRLGELLAILEHMSADNVTERGTLDWLASLLRGIIQLEAIPFGTDRFAGVKPFWNLKGRI